MSEHEKIRADLAALVAGGLPAAEEAAARAHLAACSECARELEVWKRLTASMRRIPETLPTPARLARITALAQARRVEVLAERRNRLLLTGLALYGWALFLAAWPLLEALTDWLGGWLGVSSLAASALGIALWVSFTWMASLGLLPLLRPLRVSPKERIA